MVENEEASASVVVKMTDSFTEQADQVTLRDLVGGKLPEGIPTQPFPFFFSMIVSQVLRAPVQLGI